MGELDQTLDETPEGSIEAPRPFAVGTTIGHFRIVRELGSGGMGVVFEAHDPDLDRRVAVKIVRGRDADSAGGARLIREAQAMARLTHPNVVAVHEVGTIAGEVFVVMELVRGSTLAAWLDEPRPWRAIVAALVQAGDGLVAAHHAGLVHRDFKPNNVLIDDGGRVRVTDFGLARADDDPHLAVGSDVVGTPAFMAPEQRSGCDVDARADQYSFALSLQYALGPKHAIGMAPRRIRAAIARGLAIDPDARFPTLEAMIAELRAGLASRWRIASAGAVAAVTIGGVVVAWEASRSEPTDDACTAGAQLVDEIWHPGARGRMVATFIGQRPYGATSIAASAQFVDEWVAAWKLGRRAACGVTGEQRAARLGCLDQGLHDLRAQLAVWSRADGEIVDRAVDAAAALAPPGRCAVARNDTPMEPAMREHFSNIFALQHSGRPREAQPEAAALMKLAEATGDPAQRAPAYYAAGVIARQLGDLERARSYLARAAAEAGRAGQDERMLDALMVESSVVIDQGRPLDSLGILDAAAAIIARLGDERLDDFALAHGDALVQAGRLAEGTVELERAVELLEARAARDPSAKLQLARGLGVLAGAHGQRYEWAKAYDLLRRCLAIEEAAYGALHPEVARTLHDLATNANRLGRFDEGVALLERARKIFVTTYGDHHLLVGDVDISLALAAVLQKQPDVSRRYLLRAQATLTPVLPADHPHLAMIQTGLGTVERDLDRCEEAIPYFERAVAILERIGRGGTDLATHLVNLGSCLSDLGRFTDARPHIERSLVLLDEAHVADRDKAEQWTALADIEEGTGHRAKATELRRRVLASTSEGDADLAEIRKYVRDRLAARSK